MIWVIVRNDISYDRGIRTVDHILLISKGYFTDEMLADELVDKLNKENRLKYCDEHWDRSEEGWAHFFEAAEEGSSELVDEMVGSGLMDDDLVSIEEMEEKLDLYSYVQLKQV